MDYKKYFQQLINIAKDSGLELKHNYNNHYINVKTIDGYKFNLVVSTEQSKAYGENFTGFIVEIYMDGANFREKFNNLYLQRLKIDSEIENLIWQDSSPTGKVCRIFSRKEVNIENENEWGESINWQINTLLKFLEVIPKYTKELKKENKMIMTEEETRKIIEKFIENELERNEIDEYDDQKFIELETSTGQKFIIYKKNQEKSIFVKPKNGNQNFSEPIKRIIDYVVHNNSSNHNDKSYIIPIANKIFKNAITEFISNPKAGNEMKIKNIILYGAPGVGKTHNYRKLISLIEQGKLTEKDIFNEIESSKIKYELEDFDNDLKSRVEFITFHQSFGYEDFIEGFRPNENGDIILQDGIFKTQCQKASNEEDKSFYLVIDEINRGNISKIFGELITLIEESKRDDYEVTLPYSKEKFSVPSNLYIIGTMNTTDKSIALIDVALRRRFTFIKMQPNPELVIKSFQDTFIKLNKQIKTDLGEEYQIGHSYFMNIDESDLDFVKEYKIKPLLEEYYYGDNDKLKDALKIIGFEEEQI